MKKSCALLAALALAPFNGFGQTKDVEPKVVLLIGWDGAQRNHVNECRSRGELPVLDRLAKEGKWEEITVKGTTDTKAGWSQILTGYNPEITGVYSNRRYGAIPAGLSVFERLEKKFGNDGIFTAAVIAKKGHVDADGPDTVALDNLRPKRREALAKKRGGTEVLIDGKSMLVVPGKPYYFTQHGMDHWENGLKTNEAVATKAMALLTEHKSERMFLFIHFAEVDHSGHGFGENSVEYNDALRSCDLWTGRILDTLKTLGISEKALIYVTADHGFDEGMKRHSNAPDIFLATNDRGVSMAGTRADITPTILKRFGVDLAAFAPPLSGHPLLAE